MATLKHNVHVPAPQGLTIQQKNRLVDLYGSVFFSSYESSKRDAVTNLLAELTSFDYQQRQPAVATLTDELFAAICGVFLEGTSTHSDILLELLPFVVKRRDIVFSTLDIPTDPLKVETLELHTPDAVTSSNVTYMGPADNIHTPCTKGLSEFRSSIENSFDFSFRLFSQLDLETISPQQKSALRDYVAKNTETKLGILLGLLVNPTHRFTLEDFGLEKIHLNPKFQQSLINGICASNSPLSLLDSIVEKADITITDKDKINVKDFIFQQVGDITVTIITKELQRSLPIGERLAFITKMINYFKPHIENFINQIDLSNNPEYSYNQLRQICTLLSNPIACNLLTLSPESMDKLVSIVGGLKSRLSLEANDDWGQLTDSLTASLDFYTALNADAKTNAGDSTRFNALLNDPAAYTAIKKEIDDHRHDIRDYIFSQYLGADAPIANKDTNKVAKFAYLLVSDPDLWSKVNPYQNYNIKVIFYNIFGAYKNIFDPNDPNSEVSKLKGLHSSIASKFNLDYPIAASTSPRQHSPGRDTSPRSQKPIISPLLPMIPPPSQPVSPRAVVSSSSAGTSPSLSGSDDEGDHTPTSTPSEQDTREAHGDRREVRDAQFLAATSTLPPANPVQVVAAAPISPPPNATPPVLVVDAVPPPSPDPSTVVQADPPPPADIVSVAADKSDDDEVQPTANRPQDGGAQPLTTSTTPPPTPVQVVDAVPTSPAPDPSAMQQVVTSPSTSSYAQAAALIQQSRGGPTTSPLPDLTTSSTSILGSPARFAVAKLSPSRTPSRNTAASPLYDKAPPPVTPIKDLKVSEMPEPSPPPGSPLSDNTLTFEEPPRPLSNPGTPLATGTTDTVLVEPSPPSGFSPIVTSRRVKGRVLTYDDSAGSLANPAVQIEEITEDSTPSPKDPAKPPGP